jgi:hypothetical protein
VPAFEEYVKRISYSVSLCIPRDPQSKGKVKEVIGYIKQSFLESRIYTGIDSLNSAALAWLDMECNGRIHTVTGKVPREMFMEEQNLILLGKCGTGKNGLAMQLEETAISNGHKTYYAPFDNFIAVAEKKATNPKAEATFSYMQECDLIIIDDVFYVKPTGAELQVFYRAVTFLNETRSIIFITNRELSA